MHTESKMKVEDPSFQFVENFKEPASYRIMSCRFTTSCCYSNVCLKLRWSVNYCSIVLVKKTKQNWLIETLGVILPARVTWAETMGFRLPCRATTFHAFAICEKKDKKADRFAQRALYCVEICAYFCRWQFHVFKLCAISELIRFNLDPAAAKMEVNWRWW